MNSNRKDHSPLLPGKPSGSRAAFIAAVAAIAAVVYLNTLSNGFVWDDNILILKNRWITGIRYLPQIFSSSLWSFQENPAASNYYRPMLFVIYMVEHYIFGLKPWGWHLANIIFHSINSVLVFLIASNLLRQDAGMPASQNNAASRRNGNLTPAPHPALFPFIASVLFALHTVNTETVAWAACMAELLYTFFFLLSFYLYMSADSGKGQTRITYLVLSVASFFMATLSKETAVPLLMILPVYDYTKRRLEYPRLKRYIPYLAAAGLYIILRLNAMEGLVEREPFLPDYFAQLINVFPVFTAQLFKLFLPVGLSPFNVYNRLSSVLDIKLFLSLIVTAGFFVFIWRLQRHLRSVLIPCFFITVPLLPTFYLLFYNPDTSGISILSERYLYLPAVGFAIYLSMALQWVSGRLGTRMASTLLLSATLILAGLYAFGTLKRNRVWKDDYTLWTRTVETEPDNYLARAYLASIYRGMGQNEKALKELLESTKIRPGFTGSHHRLGLLYYSMGQPVKAEMAFKKVLAITPENSDAYYNIALIYMDAGRWDDAIRELKRALPYAGKERMLIIRNGLAVSYVRIGRIEEARNQLRMALDADPGDEETLRNLRDLERLYH